MEGYAGGLGLKRILIFADTGWCIGEIHRNIAPYIGGECIPWWEKIPDDKLHNYDLILTEAGDGTKHLIEYYGIPRERILAVSHAEQDSQRLLHNDGDANIRQYAGYGVVSDTLACSSISIGITRVPSVLRVGVDCSFYDSPIPEKLETVGYGASYRRTNEFGVEIKRGPLAEISAKLAGLRFTTAVGPGNYRFTGTPKESMPAYYRSVDCVIMSSLQEGGGMPPLEAAAAGRLVIGTPVGNFPRLAYEGMGIMAPLNAKAFVDFTYRTLVKYRDNPVLFREKCASIKEAAQKRAWINVMPDWIRFASQASL